MIDDFWTRKPSRRRAAKIQFLLSYVGIGVSIATGILLVPIYLRFIPERLYGLWLATGGMIGWLGMLDMGVSSVMGQRIAAAYGRKDQRAVGLYYFNGLLLQSFITVLLLCIAVILSLLLPRWLKASPQEGYILARCNMLACLSMGLTLLTYGQKNTADALLRPFFPSLMIALGGLITVGVILTLLFYGAGLYALALGMVVGSVISLAANLTNGMLLMRRAGGPMRYDRSTLSDMLKLSPAMLFGKAGNALVGKVEPTLISWLLRPEDAVAYSMTRRAADMIQQMLDRILGSVFAGFAHHVAEQKQESSARLVSRLISLCLTLGIITLSTYLVANASFIQLWLSPRFFAGQTVTLLIALSIFSLVFNNLFGCLLGASGDIAWSALATGLEGVTRLLLMIGLLWGLGLPGLPLAVVLNCAAFTICLYFRLRSRLPSNEKSTKNWQRLVVAASATVVSATAIGVAWRASNWWSLCIGAFIFMTAATVAWVPGDPTLLETLKALLTRFAWKLQGPKIRG